jgi:antirestriction protein ArdC
MSHAAVRARTGRDRTNLYQEITDKIIAELEAGRLPWVQPWLLGGPGAAGYAKNAATPRRYSGINVLVLWGAVVQHGFPGQNCPTFRLRGLANAATEWALITLAYNCRRVARLTATMQPA